MSFQQTTTIKISIKQHFQGNFSLHKSAKNIWCRPISQRLGLNTPISMLHKYKLPTMMVLCKFSEHTNLE